MHKKAIYSTDSVKTKHTTGYKEKNVILEVGNTYEIVFKNPTNKKDRKNNGRIVEVLGFTSCYMGDVIVKYKDNNRRGRLQLGCLLPCCREKNKPQ